jgi:hypothetical protein
MFPLLFSNMTSIVEFAAIGIGVGVIIGVLLRP